MDVLREREVKDSLERQLTDERRLRGKFFFKILIKILFNAVDKSYAKHETKENHILICPILLFVVFLPLVFSFFYW